MKIAIVGSSGSWAHETYEPVHRMVLLLPEGTEVLTRKVKSLSVDMFVEHWCHTLGVPLRVFESVGPSRGGAFVRDVELAGEADKVVAIFAPDKVMDGGTGHIVEKALDLGKEVEAYTVERGSLVYIGGQQPEP